MHGKTRLFLLASAFLLTMCKSYTSGAITYQNGLSCQNYVDYQLFEQGSEGADCTYTCPNGSTEQVEVPGSVSPLYAASPEELDEQFCGIAAPPSPTPTAASATPASTRSPTPASSPTRTASPTIVATAEPLLSGSVSMCDLGGKLINFRILDSAPDLTGKTLDVQIADNETTCYVNRTNPSLLTCLIPNNISFPAQVVVSLDGAVVNDFVYSGLGCTILTTPTARSY